MPFAKSLCAVSLGLLAAGGLAQEIRPADTLQPDDLGMKKWTFTAEEQPGEVVVFQWERYLDAKLISRAGIISKGRAQRQPDYALLVDLGFFTNVPRDGCLLKTPSNTFRLQGLQLLESAWASGGNGPPYLTLVFQDPFNESTPRTKFVFTMWAEAFETVKARHPELPAHHPSVQFWTQTFEDPTIKP